MGTGYFIKPSASLARIWGCNCVCFCCCFVLQADKEEPAGGRRGLSRDAIEAGDEDQGKGRTSAVNGIRQACFSTMHPFFAFESKSRCAPLELTHTWLLDRHSWSSWRLFHLGTNAFPPSYPSPVQFPPLPLSASRSFSHTLFSPTVTQSIGKTHSIINSQELLMDIDYWMICPVILADFYNLVILSTSLRCSSTWNMKNKKRCWRPWKWFHPL